MGRIGTTITLAALVSGLAAVPAAAQQNAGKVAFINSRLVLAAAPVPIPPAIALFAGGVAAFGLWARKRRRQTPALAA